MKHDMKLAVPKNHLGGKILYRNPDRPLKNGVPDNSERRRQIGPARRPNFFRRRKWRRG